MEEGYPEHLFWDQSEKSYTYLCILYNNKISHNT